MILKLMSGVLHNINEQIIFHIDLVLPSKISGNVDNMIEILKALILKAQYISCDHLILAVMEPLYFPPLIFSDKAYNPTLSPLKLAIQSKPFTPSYQYIIIKSILLNQFLWTYIISHIIFDR